MFNKRILTLSSYDRGIVRLFAMLLFVLSLPYCVMRTKADGNRAYARTTLQNNSSKFELPPRSITAEVTFYCPCTKCTGKTGPWNERTTSLGLPATRYTGVATAFSLLPPYTLLDIPGVGRRVVDDTGRDMRAAAEEGRYHIDVRVPSHDLALQLGRRKDVLVTVYN